MEIINIIIIAVIIVAVIEIAYNTTKRVFKDKQTKKAHQQMRDNEYKALNNKIATRLCGF